MTKDFFIRPELTTFFTDGHEKKMFEQFNGSGDRGTRWDDPLYFIMNAISTVEDMDSQTYDAALYFNEL